MNVELIKALLTNWGRVPLSDNHSCKTNAKLKEPKIPIMCCLVAKYAFPAAREEKIIPKKLVVRDV